MIVVHFIGPYLPTRLFATLSILSEMALAHAETQQTSFQGSVVTLETRTLDMASVANISAIFDRSFVNTSDALSLSLPVQLAVTSNSSGKSIQFYRADHTEQTDLDFTLMFSQMFI